MGLRTISTAHPTLMDCEFHSVVRDDVTQIERLVKCILFFYKFCFWRLSFLREGIEGGDKWQENLSNGE